MTRPTFALITLLLSSPVFAQNAAPPAVTPAAQGEAQLRLLVEDQTNAGIPTATVTVTPPVGEPIVVMTDERGAVTVPGLPVGDVRVHVEFVGFETVEGTMALRRGANNHTVTLRLAGLTDEVTVSNTDTVGGDTRGSAMTTSLSQEEIEALPDDPEDIQAYLEELAGPGGATFFLNGFRGGQLPTRDEIRSIRIRTNSFSADGHESGGRTGIEIITRPSTGGFNGGVGIGYQGSALNARNAQSLQETPEGRQQVQLQFRGPIIRNRTSFSLNVNGNSSYQSNPSLAVDLSGRRLQEAPVRVPSDSRNVNFNVEHALNNNSTLRLGYQGQQNEGRNQGLSQFDLPERASQRETSGNMFRSQVQGVIGASMLNEIRFELNRRTNESTSAMYEPTVIVQDAFGMGGAGVNSRSLNQTFELADNFDFTPAKNHQMRVGLLLEGGSYEYFDETNVLGRTVYASLEDYQANRPLQFSQRFGAVDTSFNQYQFGFYVQDDIRINSRLTLGIGLRNEMQSHIGDKLNLMPRIGFALNPGGNRTSIRGGYGVYHDWYEASVHDQTLRLNGTTVQEIQVNYQYDELGNLLNTFQPGTRPTNKTVAAPDLKMPYVHQSSIGVEHQLLENLSVQLTYQRLVGRNQLRGIDINYGELVNVDGRMVRVRPDPSFGIITQIQSTGESESDRLTLQVRHPLRVGERQIGFVMSSYQLGYAESNYNGATSLPVDSLNPDLDWGPQGQDIRHQAQFGGMINLPWDVRLQGQLRYRSAPAYNQTTGLDDNLDGVINDRPFGVTRNALRGEATWDLTNLNLTKTIGFGGSRTGDGGGFPGGGGRGGPGFQRGPGGGGGGGGFPGGGRGGFNNANSSRYNVQFSVQVSNPLNRVIRTGYTGNMLSPYFGTATGVARPRQIEFNTSFRF